MSMTPETRHANMFVYLFMYVVHANFYDKRNYLKEEAITIQLFFTRKVCPRSLDHFFKKYSHNKRLLGHRVVM